MKKYNCDDSFSEIMTNIFFEVSGNQKTREVIKIK
jgi:hypothetical protein